MANRNAVVKVSVDYVSPSGASTTWPLSGFGQKTTCPYHGQGYGALDVPDTEVADTVHEVPFGDIASATAFAIVNRTGQALNVVVNGVEETTPLFSIPIGGFVSWGAPAADGDTPITRIALVTTATQAGDGTIEFIVFGDPT